MSSDGRIVPSSLSLKDLPWQIHWEKDRCTLCGRCTAVCPVHAIELGVHRKRIVHGPVGLNKAPSNVYQVYYGIRQKTDPAYACMGCAMCSLVCPNDCIIPYRSDEADKLKYHINRGGAAPEARGPQECRRRRSGSNQVYPHIHVDRPGPGCRTS
jgi:glutamate synthase (NADPH/NADH) large chain